MMDEVNRKMRIRAKELCRKDIPCNPRGISARNAKIIQILMKEFNTTFENATYQFKNNNSSED